MRAPAPAATEKSSRRSAAPPVASFEGGSPFVRLVAEDVADEDDSADADDPADADGPPAGDASGTGSGAGEANASGPAPAAAKISPAAATTSAAAATTSAAEAATTRPRLVSRATSPSPPRGLLCPPTRA